MNNANEAEVVRVAPQPPSHGSRKCHGDLLDEVSAASGFPDEGFEWICEVDTTQGMDVFDESGKFLSLDAKTPPSLAKLLGSGGSARRVNLAKENIELRKSCSKLVRSSGCSHITRRPKQKVALDFQD